MGQVIDAKVLNLPSKGDRSNTCVRSEGYCAASELLNRTTSSVRRRTPPSKEDFLLNEYMFRVPTLPELNRVTTHKFGRL